VAAVSSDQVVERIRKLLDRARRDASVEGNRARDLARKLMQQHGISAADLELVDGVVHSHFERAPAAPSVDVDVMKSKKGKKIPVRVRVGRGIEIRFEL
jgi:hypothetical protein